MTRIFLPPEKLSSNHIHITGEQAHYLSLVLRLAPGELLTVFDGHGYRYECKTVSVHRKGVIAEVIKKDSYSTESPITVILAQGIAKGDKMDFIVQKSTETGVSKIVPLITERSQVRHTGKIERWRKIALSASQQSGRSRVPDIEEPVYFREFLKNANVERSPGLIFSEEQKGKSLKEILETFRDIKTIMLIIGPEGGFSHEEVELAAGKGFAVVSLGPRILRTETAPIAAASIIQYELGDMN